MKKNEKKLYFPRARFDPKITTSGHKPSKTRAGQHDKNLIKITSNFINFFFKPNK